MRWGFGIFSYAILFIISLSSLMVVNIVALPLGLSINGLNSDSETEVIVEQELDQMAIIDKEGKDVVQREEREGNLLSEIDILPKVLEDNKSNLRAKNGRDNSDKKEWDLDFRQTNLEYGQSSYSMIQQMIRLATKPEEASSWVMYDEKFTSTFLDAYILYKPKEENNGENFCTLSFIEPTRVNNNEFLADIYEVRVQDIIDNKDYGTISTFGKLDDYFNKLNWQTDIQTKWMQFQSEMKCTSSYLTGFGPAAGVATLARFHNLEGIVYSFGAPRVINNNTLKLKSEYKINRIILEGDILPRLPCADPINCQQDFHHYGCATKLGLSTSSLISEENFGENYEVDKLGCKSNEPLITLPLGKFVKGPEEYKRVIDSTCKDNSRNSCEYYKW